LAVESRIKGEALATFLGVVHFRFAVGADRQLLLTELSPSLSNPDPFPLFLPALGPPEAV
jgi:hypothetical protein